MNWNIKQALYDAYVRLKTRAKDENKPLPLEAVVDAVNKGKKIEGMLESKPWGEFMLAFAEYRELLLNDLSLKIKSGKFGVNEIAILSAHIAGMTDAFSPIRMMLDAADNAKTVLEHSKEGGERDRIIDQLRQTG